jgi:putative redox protein
MSSHVVAKSHGGYLVEASNGSTSIDLDLTKADGGEGRGLGPHETLLAALGGCMVITLKLYAARKAWPLEDVEVTLTHAKPAAGSDPAAKESITTQVRLIGPLDDAQRAKLMEISHKCPVHKLLLAGAAISDVPAA